MSPTAGARRRRPVAVVTDSTAGLPAELVARHQLTVVPLTVTIDGASGREGIDIAPADVAKALVARHSSITTSRPSPVDFAAAYGRLLDGGAAGVVSVHLSAKLSGTYDAAKLAAAEYPDRVVVVDSQSTGMGLGFAALAAGGFADLAAGAEAARAAVARITTLFYVDTLEYLRRGGRIGAASALVGTALSVKPILRMVDGEIVVRDKVRTASRALTRLVDLAVEAAGDAEVEVGVQHLAASARADELVVRLGERLGDRLRACYETEIGAAVGAHVGPGLASVAVYIRSTA
jgi:DegV family protein with EDD domain